MQKVNIKVTRDDAMIIIKALVRFRRLRDDSPDKLVVSVANAITEYDNSQIDFSIIPELLQYGEFIEDVEYIDDKNNYVRYRLISFQDSIYSLYMINGDVTKLKKVV